MSPTDMLDTLTSNAGAVVERMDTDRMAAIVSDIAVGELVASALPVAEAASEQIAKTARLSWKWRQQLVMALVIGVTIGVAAVVIRRRRASASEAVDSVGEPIGLRDG
jgi:hypothetical protein